MIFLNSCSSNIREISHKNRICAVNSNGASLVDCTFLVKMMLKMKWLLNKQSFRHIFEYWRRVSSCYNSMLKIQTDLIIMQIVCSSTPFFAPANSPYLTIILPRLFSWKHWTKPTSDNKSFINNKIALILGAVHKCDLDLSTLRWSENPIQRGCILNNDELPIAPFCHWRILQMSLHCSLHSHLIHRCFLTF